MRRIVGCCRLETVGRFPTALQAARFLIMTALLEVLVTVPEPEGTIAE